MVAINIGDCESSVGSYFSDEKPERKRRRDDESDGETSCNESATTTEQKAEPLIRCAWAGDFDVRYDESIYRRRICSFNAYVSSKACFRVRDAVLALEGVIQFEMMQRPSLWPRSFRNSGPTGDDIALYFFPPLPMHEPPYDSLVYEMINGDLGMRAVLDDSELLIFTSAVLRPPSGRFQGKFYLWGVFRSRKD